MKKSFLEALIIVIFLLVCCLSMTQISEAQFFPLVWQPPNLGYSNSFSYRQNFPGLFNNIGSALDYSISESLTPPPIKIPLLPSDFNPWTKTEGAYMLNSNLIQSSWYSDPLVTKEEESSDSVSVKTDVFGPLWNPTGSITYYNLIGNNGYLIGSPLFGMPPVGFNTGYAFQGAIPQLNVDNYIYNTWASTAPVAAKRLFTDIFFKNN
ncbi:MAG: hypothetical protein ACMUJM_25440 [bacterium]